MNKYNGSKKKGFCLPLKKKDVAEMIELGCMTPWLYFVFGEGEDENQDISFSRCFLFGGPAFCS